MLCILRSEGTWLHAPNKKAPSEWTVLFAGCGGRTSPLIGTLLALRAGAASAAALRGVGKRRTAAFAVSTLQVLPQFHAPNKKAPSE